MNPESCVLCGCPDSLPVQVLDTADVASRWFGEYGADVSGEFGSVAEISRRRCAACGLEFFVPPCVGSGSLYAALQDQPMYYLPRKWEHDVALQMVPEGARLLEIGCGTGEFLDRASRERSARVEGIEISEKAIHEAERRGLHVRKTNVEDFAVEEPGRYNIVCAFQVLEHVGDPRSFIQSCVSLLRPGGRLILGVPNSAGFIGRDPRDLLNQPPHHATRWSPSALIAVQKQFFLDLERLLYEPFSAHHARWYAYTQLYRIPRFSYYRTYLRWCLETKLGCFPWLGGVAARMFAGIVASIAGIARILGSLRLLKGHTVLACYTVNGPGHDAD